MEIIKKVLKKTFPQYANHYRAYRSLIQDKTSYLHQTGWYLSLSLGRPVDGANAPVPWMNYPVVEFLKNRFNKEMLLFEYGSGHSTSFYAKLVKEVVSLEYDQNWLETVRPTLPSNVTLIYQSQDVAGKYCKAISSTNFLYDVVIVDGRDRVNCIIQSELHLTNRGVLILDDSHRDRYKAAFEHLSAKGFKELTFKGLKPTGSEVDCTTVFYRTDNCLNL